MIEELPRRSIVILSTTPPIPRDYGNRNRVFQTLAFFRSLDFAVSFLLYPFDKEWAADIPRYYKQLSESFDFFAVIPNSRPLHQPARAYHHDIDEWWDDNIGQYLTWLFARRRFDALLVNYTFLSKAFEYTPKNTLKILDTHDLFSDRREIFETNGVAAEFFYTNEEQERIGFDRSDLIIAIKQYEKRIIKTMTRKPVICLPYWDDRPVDRRAPMVGADGYSDERPLRLGFIGAFNSVNVVNLRRFLETFASFVRLYNLPVEMLVAGNVCKGIDQEYSFLRKIGFVEDIAAFYDNIDIIVAPLEFSTGIKIKVGEALARGLPVLATRNAFDGFRPYHASQDLPNLAALCDTIVLAAYGELTPAELATAAHKAAVTAARAQHQAFGLFRDSIVAALRRIVLVTDRPFWYRANFFDEMVSQSIEFLAQITPPIVCYLSEERVAPDKIHAQADFIGITGGAEALSAVLDRLFDNYSVAGAIIMTTEDQMQEKVLRQLKPRRVASWSMSIQFRGINTGVVFRGTGGAEEVIELAPLRYLPGTRPLDIAGRDHVSLFISAAADEWSRLARDCVDQLASEFGLSLRTVTVPPYHEFDSRFFSETLDAIAVKSILIVGDGFYPAFVLQLLALNRAGALLVHPDFICPEFVGPQGLPSLEGSLRAFFNGEFAGRVQAHSDTGWSAVWDRLSSQKTEIFGSVIVRREAAKRPFGVERDGPEIASPRSQ
jgi:glycosyltransferase involved in cell wall biosynthesis